MLGEIAQSTTVLIHPPAALELVASTKSLVMATPAPSAYKAISKFAVLVPALRYQPICVILTAPAGLVCFTTTEEPSMVVSEPAGSVVGATVTKPTLVPSVNAIDGYLPISFSAFALR